MSAPKEGLTKADVDNQPAYAIRWEHSRGIAGAWNLDQLGHAALVELRHQVTMKIRRVSEGGPRCTCLELQDADTTRHLYGCARQKDDEPDEEPAHDGKAGT